MSNDKEALIFVDGCYYKTIVYQGKLDVAKLMAELGALECKKATIFLDGMKVELKR
jgi:hypothetical protein